MRRGKSIRWHIDVLTEGGTVLGAWTFPDGDECDLITGLSHLPVAIKGFGSTDCRRSTNVATTYSLKSAMTWLASMTVGVPPN
jgi:Uri superfamily endonuclease